MAEKKLEGLGQRCACKGSGQDQCEAIIGGGVVNYRTAEGKPIHSSSHYEVYLQRRPPLGPPKSSSKTTQA
jgi:hypothetical protein